MDYISDAPDAPAAIGPYSQVVLAGGFAFLSGQIPLDPKSGQIVEGGIEIQTEQVMKNISAVLKRIDRDFGHVAKATIFLTDLKNFEVVNRTYERWLGGKKPARSTIQVAGLPRASLVEIEMVVFLG